MSHKKYDHDDDDGAEICVVTANLVFIASSAISGGREGMRNKAAAGALSRMEKRKISSSSKYNVVQLLPLSVFFWQHV